MADPVELTDLDVIARYSLAVRSATADRDEVIAVLRSDLDWLESGRRTPRRAARPTATPSPRRTTKRAAATDARRRTR